MSSHHHLGVKPPSGDVEHISFLSEHIGALFGSTEYSDISLLVEGQAFPAHKVILAARSDYFRALLFGGMKESQQTEIELKGTSLVAFKVLLQYIYTGRMSLFNTKEEVILEVLGLAHQYGFIELESAISDYLKAILQIRNVCMIYDIASLYQLQSLAAVCCGFTDRHALEIVQHESFLSLSAPALREMILRDSFCAPEAEIFRAVCDWAKQNPDSDPGELQGILSAVRLPLMSVQELLNVVRPTGLLQPDMILDAIKSRTESRDMDLKYRGYLMAEENVAHPKHGTQVLKGEMRAALLDGDSQNYDMEHGFTRHAIDDTGDQGILVKLGMECIINHMRLLLWDRDLRSYSYYVEVSMDQKDWVRVVDHTKYYCRSWQDLYFPARVVRFIRIVGTNNTVNKVFHVVTLEALYTSRPFRLEDGLIAPTRNVATVACSACVVEGVSRSRNALLNGDTSNYDWDSGYTCHQLGSGAIVVQLNQPYVVDSMKLLLWDCDDRHYSYYVEASIDMKDWVMLADRTRERCRSWQTLSFTRRPVVFVRIVGTNNTANEVFHCVHFECPGQVEGDTESTTSSEKESDAASTASGSRTNPVEVKVEDDSEEDVFPPAF